MQEKKFKKGDLVRMIYSGKVGKIEWMGKNKDTISSYINHEVYVIKTTDNKLIGAIKKDLKKLSDREYIIEVL